MRTRTTGTMATLLSYLQRLDADLLAALARHPSELRRVAERLRSFDYLQPIADQGVARHLTRLVTRYRRLADDRGHDGPVVWRLSAGFALLPTAIMTGRLSNSFEGMLRHWDSFHSRAVPTRESWLFGTAYPLRDCLNLPGQEQLSVLAQLRRRYDLPKDHLQSFGSAQEVAALLLTDDFRRGCAPIQDVWLRTDSSIAEDRVSLGFFKERLEYTYCTDGQTGNHSCLALGRQTC